MNVSTWNRLAEYFRKSPGDAAPPGTEDEVNALAARLGSPMPDQYRDFLLRYGGAYIGQYPVYGVHRSKATGLGKLRAAEVNEGFRQQGWPHADEWLIVSEDGYGNAIGIADDGRVLVWDHELGGIYELGSSFEDFLLQELDRMEES